MPLFDAGEFGATCEITTSLFVTVGQPEDLGVEVLDGEREQAALHHAVRHRVELFVAFAQRAQQLLVEFVEQFGGRAAERVGVVHVRPPRGSGSSRFLSLARQRPRVGPMLPRGMPRATATAS